MIGNIWEWTSESFSTAGDAEAPHSENLAAVAMDSDRANRRLSAQARRWFALAPRTIAPLSPAARHSQSIHQPAMSASDAS
jgi:formylglycine-generating enzyme required for sulfatase activity